MFFSQVPRFYCSRVKIYITFFRILIHSKRTKTKTHAHFKLTSDIFWTERLLTKLTYPTSLSVPPRFEEAPVVYHMAYENWDTTLSCQIFGYPPPAIKWTRSFRSLPHGRHLKAGKELVIWNVQKEDRGPIMCRGDNHLGHVYALIVLVVNPVCKLIKLNKTKIKHNKQIRPVNNSFLQC